MEDSSFHLLTVGLAQRYSLQGGCLPSWQQGECHDAAAAGMLRARRREIIWQNKSKSQRKSEWKFKGPRPAKAHHWIASLAAHGGGGGGWGQEQVHRVSVESNPHSDTSLVIFFLDTPAHRSLSTRDLQRYTRHSRFSWGLLETC